MSPFDKINFVRKLYNLTASQKSILFVIVTRLGNNDFMFLDLEQFRLEACLSKGVLTKNIKDLINMGIVIKKEPNSEYKCNQYSINFDTVKSLIEQNIGTSAVAVPLENDDSAVRQPYPCSTTAVPLQYDSRTPAVRQPYPKRNINKIEKKDKDPPVCPPDTGGANSVKTKKPKKKSQTCIDKELISKLFKHYFPHAYQIAKWTKKRLTALRNRCMEDKDRLNPEWWQEYFEIITSSKFLMGEVHSRDRKPFLISIDFVLREDVIVSVYEGKYHYQNY